MHQAIRLVGVSLTMLFLVACRGSDSDPGESNPASNQPSASEAQQPARITVTDATARQGESESLDFTIELQNSNHDGVTLEVASRDGSAIAGKDYEAFEQAVEIEAGQDSTVVSVPLLNQRVLVETREMTLEVLSKGQPDASPSTASATPEGRPGKHKAAGRIEPNPGFADLMWVGAAKRAITPHEHHIEGLEEERVAGTHRHQKFNLGGFGLNPLQNYPDPVGGFGDELVEPVGDRVYTNHQGEEEHTWLRVMVLSQSDEDGQERQVAFIILDAVGAGNVITNDLKSAVSAATGIAPENVIFGSTHSHAGADLQGLWGGVPQDWIDNVLYPAAAESVREAQANLCPSEMTVAQGKVPDFNRHRRLDVDIHAEADPHLTLLQAHCQAGPNAGGVSGSLLQYNAHPTNIGTSAHHDVPELDGRVAHADYILGAVEQIENASDGVALYYNGPIGDASNTGPGGENPYERSRNRGGAIADAGLGLAPRPLESSLEVRHEQALLPVTNPAFLAAGALGSFNRYYDFLMLPTGDIPFIGPEFENLPQLTPTAETTVSRITIGGSEDGLEIVTIPGEATNTFGEYIRTLADTEVMLLGLTQQAFGYIIPEEAFNYVDPTGGSGFLVPFTDYEEFLSLGPLTAPLLRLQGYNPLFGIDADDTRNLPPWLTPCMEDPRHPDCILTDIGQNLDFIQRGYAQQCDDADLPSEFCILLNPDTPLREPCLNAGFSEDFCRVFGAGGSDDENPAEQDEPSLATLEIETQTAGCDPLDAGHCMYPFPSNHFTRQVAPHQIGGTEGGGTGRRVSFNPLGMPRNIAGKPIDPTEWNRNDGFSPGQMLTTYVPDLGVVPDDNGDPKGPVKNAVPLNDLGRYLDPDTAVVVIDTETGERHPIWVEADLNAGEFFPPEGRETPGEAQSALLVRPAVNFREGHRYVVALRNLVDNQDEPIEAGTFFATCRDQGANAFVAPGLRSRCTELESEVFPVLDDHGIPTQANEDLYLAWDFTVASAENNVARLRHMRDDAFASLADNGDADCVQYQDDAGCATPEFDVTEVIKGHTQGKDYREIHGTFEAPSYVVPADPSPLEGAPLIELLESANDDVLAGLEEECLANAPDDLFCEALTEFREEMDGSRNDLRLATSVSAPPNRLFYDPTDELHLDDPAMQPFGDGLPNRTGTKTVPWMCRLYEDSTPQTPARPGIYGHGLFDQRRAITYDSVPDLSIFDPDNNYMFCAVDWFGFATGDLGNVLGALIDISQFPAVPDATQQGMVHKLFLTRLLRDPDGFASHEAFQSSAESGEARARFDNREVFYHGISQGGILGGPVVAMSQDITRGVLGVPGMSYSLLLRRSTGWSRPAVADEIPFGFSTLPYLAYPDDLDRNIMFGLMQMLWDRGENNGYAWHITDNEALTGPDNQVMLRPAFADHLVTHWSAHNMGRTLFEANGEQSFLADMYPRPCATGVPHCFNSRDEFSMQRDPDEALMFGLPLSGTEARYDTPEGARSNLSALIQWDEGRTATPPVGNIPADWKDDHDPHGFPRKAPGALCQQSHFLHREGKLIDARPVIQGGPCPALKE